MFILYVLTYRDVESQGWNLLKVFCKSLELLICGNFVIG